ncbi:hypothetical protein OsJ_06459 [Oryza sativa Japonica Group]|uniref:Uncharacterized protein n=1 Tax=Oryza sativa subsp. japonica TaxID=39947 RepID=B9F5B5_ORYSJ|nr:hypothetical protein OsJ_06459 [Oryza sativa Japonica Group]
MASSASSATSLASSITPCSPVFANRGDPSRSSSSSSTRRVTSHGCSCRPPPRPHCSASSPRTPTAPGLLGDARCARFCGSFPGAWLAAELPESRGRGPVLLDLCTGECVALPRGCEAGESSSADSASSPSTTSGRGPPCPLCMYFLVLARNLVLMVIRFVSTRETAFDALQAGARRRAAAASLEEARNRRP